MTHDQNDEDMDEDFRQSVEALREAIKDMEAGDRGVPFDEFVAAMREKYKLPARSNDPPHRD